jgi:hypothetical protein
VREREREREREGGREREGEQDTHTHTPRLFHAFKGLFGDDKKPLKSHPVDVSAAEDCALVVDVPQLYHAVCPHV